MATTTTDLAQLLTGDLPVGPDRPLLSYCDDATGERVDLTAPQLGSWAARTAALLHEGCGLYRGDRAAVLLPPHWQTAAVLLGAWSAGITVAFRPWATAGLQDPGTGVDEPLEAVFVARTRLDSWLERLPEARHRFVLSLAPLGTAPTDVPPGYRDYLADVAQYPDIPPEYSAIGGGDAASPDGTRYRDWAVIASGIADSIGLRPGDRLLVDTAKHEQPVAWLLAPLTVGASVVLCANLTPGTLDARIVEERITHVM